MKRLICISFMALSCCLTTNVLAQVKLDDIRCAGVAGYTCNVIMPSMHNLIKLVNCNTDHFKATMKQYGYSPKDDYYGTDYCYDNWSVDLWMHGNDGKGANTYTYNPTSKVIICEISRKMIWPQDYIADWHNDMFPYYTRTENNCNFYVYDAEDALYGFMLQPSQSGETIYISVRKFIK